LQKTFDIKKLNVDEMNLICYEWKIDIHACPRYWMSEVDYMNNYMKYCIFVTKQLKISKYLVLLGLVVGCDE
jgi:hypothetical protein